MSFKAFVFSLVVLISFYRGSFAQVPGGPPENVVLSNVTPFSFDLSWDPPLIQNNVLTSYQVYLTFPNGTEFMRVFAEDERSYRESNLSPGQSFNVSVSASNMDGEGPRSNFLSIQLGSLFAPENVTIVDVTATTIEIYWEPPSGGTGPISGYFLYLRNNDMILNLTSVVSPTRYTWTGLSAYTNYTIQVTVDYQVDMGPLSAPIMVTTDELPPSVISEFVANVTSNVTASITWGPPLMPNGVLLYYNVSINSNAANFSMVASFLPDDPLVVALENLAPLVPYYVEIVASTAAGVGDTFEYILFTEQGVPPTPTITSVQRVSGDIATVAWNGLSFETATGIISHYTVAYEETSQLTCGTIDVADRDVIVISIEADPALESYELRLKDLVPGEEFCIAVSTNTTVGDSGFGDAVKINLPLNVLFQLRIRLPDDVNCMQWVADNTVQKLTDLSSNIAEYIENNCGCTQFMAAFIDSVRFECNENSTYEAISQGRIISAEDLFADRALNILQERADLDSVYTVILDSVRYEVDPYCRVNLTALGNTECTPLAGSPTIPRPTVIVAVEIVGGVAGAIAAILIVLLIVSFCCCWYVRKRSDKKYSEEADREDDFTSPDPHLVKTDRGTTSTLPRVRAARLSNVPVVQSEGYNPGYEAVGQVTSVPEDEHPIMPAFQDTTYSDDMPAYEMDDFELESEDYGYD